MDMATLLGSNRAPAAKLKELGDKVKGRITAAVVDQETDFTTRSPKFLIEIEDEKSPTGKRWAMRKGVDLTPEETSQARPIWQIVLTLETADGPKRVFLSNWRLEAAKVALKNASAEAGQHLAEFEVGGEFGLRVIHVDGNKRIGEAVYIPPQPQSEQAPF